MIPYPKHTDAQLVELVNSGDRLAFEAIYRRYAADLYRFARKNIFTAEDCEEMIQDVFESIWLRHGALKIQSLRHYLFNAVRYMIIRNIQHRGVKRRYVEYYTAFSDIYDSSPMDTPNHQELQDQLIRHLHGLPERCKTAVTLRLVEELSNAEIAKRMNISKGTVELYMCKALAHLRKVLKGTQLEIAR